MNCKNSCKIWMLTLMISIPSLFSFSSNMHTPNHSELQQILDSLWEAKGDFRFKKPSIQLSDSSIGKAAYFFSSNGNPIIEIEKKAYKICQESSNPTATLSIIIGHELAHYFQNPILVEEEQCSFSNNVFNAFANDALAKKAKELDADYKGIFNAYLANYKVRKPSREILDLLYTGYKFDKENEYAPLAQRKQVAEKVLKKTDALIALYESGNHFYAVGNYALAIAAYKKILKEYQAKEIYNNLGVAYALESLRYARKGELAFIYPIEIDTRSNLKQTQGYGEKTNPSEIRKMLLSNAFANFDLALQLDPLYKSAKLNKACAISMEGYSDPSEPAHIHHLAEVKLWHFYYEAVLLEGIRAGLNGKVELAKTKFKQVIASNREDNIKQIAQANLNILKGKNYSDVVRQKNCNDFYYYEEPEIIGQPINKQIFYGLSMYNDHTCTINFEEDAYGTMLIVGEGELTSNELYSRISLTNNTKYLFSENVTVGDTEDILTTYHCNRRIAETSDGYFRLFDDMDNSFLFNIEETTGVIRTWGVVTSNLK